MRFYFPLLLLISLLPAPDLFAQLSTHGTPIESPSPPRLVGSPPIRCIEPGSSYVETICVRDEDFASPELDEQVTLSVLSPAWMTVSPSVITADAGNICFPIEIRSLAADDTGRVRVRILATDRAGATDTLSYDVSVSAPLIFSMPLQVRNTKSGESGYSSQVLVFGMARNATSGESARALGRLDSAYCEYELPPAPPISIFDARWLIPTQTGILRSIQPENPNAGDGPTRWRAHFQPGYVDGEPRHYPVIVYWSLTDAQRALRAFSLTDPLAGAIFRIDMRSPRSNPRLPQDGRVTLRLDGDTAYVEVHEASGLEGFNIEQNFGAVDNLPAGGTGGYRLSTGTPSPSSKSTDLTFFAPKRGRVTIELFDINGKGVRTLYDGICDAGERSVRWDGSYTDNTPAPSGTYICRLSAESVQVVTTIVLVR